MIKFISDWRKVGDFLRLLQFPPLIKLTSTIITQILLKVGLISITVTLICSNYCMLVDHKNSLKFLCFVTRHLKFPLKRSCRTNQSKKVLYEQNLASQQSIKNVKFPQKKLKMNMKCHVLCTGTNHIVLRTTCTSFRNGQLRRKFLEPEL